MRKQIAYLWLCLFFLFIFLTLSFMDMQFGQTQIHFVPQDPLHTKYLTQLDEGKIRVGMWNLQIFGEKKAQNEFVMSEYVDIITKHDIFIVQEIRNKNGVAFEKLCDALRNYSYVCFNSSRAGSSNSKEQYGVFYKNNIILTNIVDHNPSFKHLFERPPLEISFEVDTQLITFVTIHSKPTEVNSEMRALAELFENHTNTIILGDLNADCSYYQTGSDFTNWLWIIHDDDDTTVGNSDCAYDRILFSPDYAENYGDSYGIIEESIASELSDHYPVWVTIEA